MDPIYILLVLVIVAMAVALLKRMKRQLKPKSVFKQRDGLFTSAERSFLGVLDQAAWPIPSVR